MSRFINGRTYRDVPPPSKQLEPLKVKPPVVKVTIPEPEPIDLGPDVKKKMPWKKKD